MLSSEQYKCETRNGVYVCIANTNQSLGLYSVLQERLRAVAGTMAAHRADIPKSLSTLEVDGRIGPTTALAAQVVLAALNQLVALPLELLPVLSDTAAGDEIIRLVAQLADGVLGYIDQTLTQYPNIMQPQVQPLAPTPPKKQKKPIPKLAWGVAAGATAMFGGLILILGRAQKASDGRQDRSQFLPEPTDEEAAALEAEEAALESAPDDAAEAVEEEAADDANHEREDD